MRYSACEGLQEALNVPGLLSSPSVILPVCHLDPESTLKRAIADIFSKLSLTKKLAGMGWMVWCESQQTGGVGRRVHLL